jgi:hypothetical protein
MTVEATRSVNDELLGVTVRLIEEFPEIAAGSVMRLVGRVVRSARWTGVPADLLAGETERTSRILLKRRSFGAEGPAFAEPPEVEFA